MRKKALWKDFFMEIRKSLNRFMSIFLIVALGVAFFAGIRATNPDMRLTADAYYDKSKLMDIRILSTLGLTEEDVAAIRNTEGVETVEPGYSTHVVSEVDGNELILEVMSATEHLNLITVKEGRMPESEKEILVDVYFAEATGKGLGDKITVSSGTEEPISDTLKQSEFTIVGIGSTAYYLSFQRGSANIGTGNVHSFIVVKPEVFALEAYTTVYALVEGAMDLNTYTEEYDERMEEVIHHLEDTAVERTKQRYDELYEKADKEIKKAKEELQEAKDKLKEEMNAALANPGLIFMTKEQQAAAAAEMEKTKQEAEEGFQAAEQEIAEAEAKLQSLKAPKWYILDRDSIEAYVEYEQNADRIGAIGKVFPVIFFLVAALISLTTMTRMVEEERIQIGTLKALGYTKLSIAGKYLLYALFATLGGSVFGALVGLKVLPYIIITAYKIMYPNMSGVVAPYNLYYAGIATIIAIFCVEFATFMSCYKELAAKPARLMRPEAPKNGKRVLLERIPFIWNKLSFTWKATVRNLMRYKKRFFMTIFGIGGCMALLMVAFGLKDSIFVIKTRQFDEIMLYQATISLNSEVTIEQQEELEKALQDNDEIEASIPIRNSAIDIAKGDTDKNVTLYVPEDEEAFRTFIHLRTRIGHEEVNLDEDGVILTEKLAKQLGVAVGDTVTITEEDVKAEAKVSQITENYMFHYVYMSPALYDKLFSKEVTYNQYLINLRTKTGETEEAVGDMLLKLPAVSGISYVSYILTLLGNILTGLDIVIWVLIISAGALAFVVLYNLNNININERRRELATIKVLGFYDPELAAYVYRENIILTLIGALFGIVLGLPLHRFIVLTVEIDQMMFGRNLDFSSYIYSILLTILFSALVNLFMYWKLKKINMVESLKSVE